MTLDDLNLLWAKSQFNSDVRVNIYRKLSSLLTNGVPMLQAMDTLYKQASKNGKTPSHPKAIALKDWIDSLRNGESLSSSMGKWVPFEEKMLIAAGESSGSLEQTMLSVCQVIEGAQKMRGAIMSGVIYPIFLLASSIAILWLFGTKVIPQFAKVTNPHSWTGMAKSMYVMSEFVKVWTIPSVIVLVIAFVALIYSLPRYTGKLRIILDRYPPWSIYRLLSGSGFIMSLAALVKSGIPLEKALIMLKEAASEWMKDRLEKAIFGLRSGLNLGQALEEAGHGFPDPEIIDDISVYATLSGFDKAMELIGNQWLIKGVESVERQAKILNQVALLLMGLIVSWIAGGLFAIQQALTDSVGAGH